MKPNIDTKNNSYKGINIKPGLDPNEYEYPDVKPNMDTDNYDFEYSNVNPSMPYKEGSMNKFLPEWTGGGEKGVITNFASILGAKVNSIVRPYTISAEESKIFDFPLITGVTKFGMILYRLRYAVIGLCTLLCTLNIIFQACRLWFGTQELKKTYVDIVWKSVCCIFLLMSYPTIVDGIMTLASGFSMSLTSGYNELNEAYRLAAESIYRQIETDLPNISEVLEKNALLDKYISDETVISLTRMYGWTVEDIKREAESHNLTIVMQGKGKDSSKPVTFYTQDGKEISEQEQIEASYLVSSKPSVTDRLLAATTQLFMSAGGQRTVPIHESFQVALAAASKGVDIKEKQKGELAKKLVAINELMDGEIFVQDGKEYVGEGRTEKLKGAQLKIINNLVYAPFIKNVANENTTLVSPSQMLRTCIIFNDALAQAAAYDSNKLTAVIGITDDGTNDTETEYNADNK